MTGVDVLVVTHKEADYAHLCLESLIEKTNQDVGIWLWHNGEHEATLAVARHFARHARVVAFHHSVQNVRLREPTNWLWQNSRAPFVGKMDDDCLVTGDWPARLVTAHMAAPDLGAVAGWHFQPEDLDLELCQPKLRRLSTGDQLLQHAWVQGSGYVLKREVIRRHGLLRSNESWPRYCLRTASRGWVHGWLLPPVLIDHLDDPRSPSARLTTDEALRRRNPLSSRESMSLQAWDAHLRQDAVKVQSSPSDPRHFLRLRSRVRDRIGDLAARKPLR